MGKLLTKIHLLKALEDNKLPSTYKSLRKYEKMGIIPFSENVIDYGTRTDRVYKQSEIDAIVEKVKEYKEKGKLKDVE